MRPVRRMDVRQGQRGMGYSKELLPELRSEDGGDNMTDVISRQQAIDAARDWYEGLICGSFKGLEKRLRSLPPAQPDIIRCRNCKFASGDSRICMKFGHSPIGELDFCAWAERRTDE